MNKKNKERFEKSFHLINSEINKRKNKEEEFFFKIRRSQRALNKLLGKQNIQAHAESLASAIAT